jgi:hypothetical protein
MILTYTGTSFESVISLSGVIFFVNQARQNLDVLVYSV